MTDIRRLRAIAQEAYYPDHPWRETLDEFAGIYMHTECDEDCPHCEPYDYEAVIEPGELRSFVATFDPPTVLALLDVVVASELWCGGEQRLLPRRVQRALTHLDRELGGGAA